MSQLLATALVAGGLAALISVLTGGPFSVSLGSVSTAGSQMTIGLYVDLLSAVLVTFIASIVLIVATYSHRNLRGQDRLSRFGLLLSGSALALALMVTAASLPLIAVGWTLSGLALAALVGHRTEPETSRAATLVRRRLLIGDVFLWSGVIMAWVALPGLDRADLALAVTPNGAVIAAAGLLAIAAVVRSALLPAWTWLPLTAHAPSPVSAYLHAGLVNGAGVLVVLAWPIFFAAPQVLAGLLVLGAATAVVATIAAKVRPDVKGQLAASTSAQMGYMAVQLGMGLPAAAVLHLIGHGYYKAWLFLRAGGAVTRRRTYLSMPEDTRIVALIAIPVAILTVGVAVLAVLPLIAETLSLLGAAAVLPVAAAGATALVTVTSAWQRSNDRRWRATVAVTALTMGMLSGYLLVLTWWDNAVASALPEVPVWTDGAAIGWLAALAIAAGITVWGVRRAADHPDGRIAVAALRTALPVRAAAGRTGSQAADDYLLAGESTDSAAAGVADLARHAAAVVGPAYPLRSLVAANPLAGLEGLPFIDAARVASRVRGARAFLPEAQYVELMARRDISRDDLAVALADYLGDDAMADMAIDEMLLQAHNDPAPVEQVLVPALAERRPQQAAMWSPVEVARLHDSLWTARVWGDPGPIAADGDLYRRWLVAANSGWGREIGVPELAAQLPESPTEALADLLVRSGVPEQEWFEYLCRLLVAAPGWAGHAVWRADVGYDGAVVELLTVRVAHDLAVGGRATGSTPLPAAEPEPVVALADPLIRQRIWQESLEEHYRNELVARLQEAALTLPVRGNGDGAPIAQVVMCIDVRSERFRRHLEAAAPVQTYGFAGFFGAAVRVVNDFGQGFDQCPVLLRPTHEIHTGDGTADALGQVGRQAARSAWSAPTTAFALAESAGILAGAASAVQTFAPSLSLRRPVTSPGSADLRRDDHDRADGLLRGFTTAELTNLAYNALHAIGLEQGFAPVLVVAGHGATVTNNAFAAAYDCGACGGNAGMDNARILAHALNDEEVRSELRRLGIHLPAETVAVAALHDTTTDELHIDEALGAAPGTIDCWARLADAAQRAGQAAATERLALLPGASAGHRNARSQVRRRAGDWAEACPEWGLAGNAAFVIGPRDLTADLDLAGRVFLHSYDPRTDPDATVLGAILTAPVVVAQWINSQYYLSTVDARHFGSGDKATHNVIGDVGVITGAHGDLRTGLPWQAVFKAESQIPTGTGTHVPLRLSVVAYADQDAIAQVVATSETLSRLVANEWISMTAIDTVTGEVSRLRPGMNWIVTRKGPGEAAEAAEEETQGSAEYARVM